jgi:hypothetical protein
VQHLNGVARTGLVHPSLHSLDEVLQ